MRPGCAEAVSSCLDSNGGSGTGGSLDTSTLGAHSYTVTATSSDGQTTTTTIRYTVAGPPSAQISAPSVGQTYTLGEQVPTSFSCTDAAGAPGISSCVDSNGGSGTSGSLDTSALGVHTYTVTATSSDLRTVTTTLSYTVIAPAILPSRHFTVISHAQNADGTIELTLRLPGAGVIDVLGTHSDPLTGALAAAVLEPGYHRLDWGRRHITVTKAGTIHVKLYPNATGLRLLARHRRYGWALHVRVFVTYTPTGGDASGRQRGRSAYSRSSKRGSRPAAGHPQDLIVARVDGDGLRPRRRGRRPPATPASGRHRALAPTVFARTSSSRSDPAI